MVPVRVGISLTGFASSHSPMRAVIAPYHRAAGAAVTPWAARVELVSDVRRQLPPTTPDGPPWSRAGRPDRTADVPARAGEIDEVADIERSDSRALPEGR